MSIAQQIIAGSFSALNILKGYLSNPSISKNFNLSPFPAIDPLFEVPIQCESYKEVGECDISQMLIVDSNSPTTQTGGKAWLTDNIAPKPRTWELQGYIGPSPAELIASPLLQISQGIKLQNLRDMRNSRQILAFKTKNSEEIVNVGIVSMNVDSRPEVQNRIPISLTVREIPVLQFGIDGLSIANPAGVANAAAKAVNIGISVGTLATSPLQGLIGAL